MLKALLKKQFMELNAGNLTPKKKKSALSPLAKTVLIYIVVIIAGGYAFYVLTGMFAEVLLVPGLEPLHWLYFAFIGIGTLLFGAFGSVFHTYSALYKAKDNELLLSMPIPPRYILIVRMAGVYVMSLFYSAVFWIPAVIRYAQCLAPSAGVIAGDILVLIPIAMLVTVLTCIAGWVVALVSGKLRNRSFVTVIIGLAFFAVYYFVCFRLYDIIQKIAANTEGISAGLKIWAYPVSQLAYGAMGYLSSLLIFTAIALAAFIFCCMVLSRTFIKITTLNKGQKKAVYKEKEAKQASIKSALLRRELKHFTNSATYMMNCGLGLVMVLAVAVIAAFNSGNINTLVEYLAYQAPDYLRFIPVALTAVICLMISMVYITAPSVSLEGKNIWIAQSLPVKTADILYAKIRLHLTLVLPVGIVSTVIIGIAFRLGAAEFLLALVNVVLYGIFCAYFGLKLNLKRPNLNWMNEAQPIKNSMPAFVCMFGGWLMVVGAGVLYIFIGKHIAPHIYLLITAAALLIVIFLDDRWIRKKGTVIFRGL